MFKLWITIVILHLLLTVGVVFAEEKHDVCKHEQKYTMLWYYNECDGEKLEIKSYQKSDNSKGKDTPWKNYKNGKGTASEIPWNANPNYEVLTKYLKKYIDNSKNTNNKIIIKKSKIGLLIMLAKILLNKHWENP